MSEGGFDYLFEELILLDYELDISNNPALSAAGDVRSMFHALVRGFFSQRLERELKAQVIEYRRLGKVELVERYPKP